MVNILISIRADLASSIAIRYAGELSKFIELGLQPIHVKQPDHKEDSLGTGWVRHTWENVLAEKGMQEINQLIKIEKANCPALAAPKVVIGDRDEEILKELQVGDYDLFMEGILPSFNIVDFQKILKSKLYQNMSCPVLMVKNLVPIEKFALLIFDGMDSTKVVSKFLEIFRQGNFVLDVIHYQGQKASEFQATEYNALSASADTANKTLEDAGFVPAHVISASGPAQAMSDYLEKYALVISSLKDGLIHRKDLLTVLAKTPSPILLC